MERKKGGNRRPGPGPHSHSTFLTLTIVLNNKKEKIQIPTLVGGRELSQSSF